MQIVWCEWLGLVHSIMDSIRSHCEIIGVRWQRTGDIGGTALVVTFDEIFIR